MKVIAISGWKGSGKDLIADYLVERDDYTKFSFANILKDTVAEQYDIVRGWCDISEYKERALSRYPVDTKDEFTKMIHTFMKGEFRKDSKGVLCWTPRALCILEGSVKRSVNSQYWVQSVIKNIDTHSYSCTRPLFVIADLRYKSEAEQLKTILGSSLELVRINRFNDNPSVDPSETDLDDYTGFDNILDIRGLDIPQVKKLISKLYVGKF